MEQTKVNTAEVENPDIPRIKPIENPYSVKLKLAYWFTKQQMGKVITPLKVVQARMPKTLSVSQKLMAAEDDLSLPDDLVFYIKSYVSTLNGCSFCIDLAKADAEEESTVNKYEQLLNYESADVFSNAEKAALKYVEEATLDKEVSDKVFENVKRYFSDREIVEIVGKTSEACRKAAQRARKRIRSNDPPEINSWQESKQVVNDFIEALRSRDITKLQRIITDDAVLYSDGGGKTDAVPKPIESVERISKFLISIADKTAGQVTIEQLNVNNRPGFRAYMNGNLHSVWTFDIREGQIRKIFSVLNPNKLPST